MRRGKYLQRDTAQSEVQYLRGKRGRRALTQSKALGNGGRRRQESAPGKAKKRDWCQERNLVMGRSSDHGRRRSEREGGTSLRRGGCELYSSNSEAATQRKAGKRHLGKKRMRKARGRKDISSVGAVPSICSDGDE